MSKLKQQTKHVCHPRHPTSAEPRPSHPHSCSLRSKSRLVSSRRFASQSANGVRLGANQLIANSHPGSFRANQIRISWEIFTARSPVKVTLKDIELTQTWEARAFLRWRAEMWARLFVLRSAGRSWRTGTEGKQRRQGWTCKLFCRYYSSYIFYSMQMSLCLLLFFRSCEWPPG